MVYCAWCHDLRSVDADHARRFEMSEWMQTHEAGPRHLPKVKF
jgi:hypothetical protein